MRFIIGPNGKDMKSNKTLLTNHKSLITSLLFFISKVAKRFIIYSIGLISVSILTGCSSASSFIFDISEQFLSAIEKVNIDNDRLIIIATLLMILSILLIILKKR